MPSSLIILLREFTALACLKKNPQDLPQSNILLIISLVLYAGISIIHTSLYKTVELSVQASLIDIVLLLGIIYLWLAIYRVRSRWTQTVTAMAGSSSILGLVAIPISYIIIQGELYPSLATIGSALMVFLFVWTITLHAHIFKHAFSTLFIGALLLAIFYNVFVLVVISSILPEINQA